MDDTIKAKGKGKLGGLREGKAVSKSKRAGLIFPVGRIGRYLKDGRYAKRVGVGASVFMAGVLEYMTTELLELAGTYAKSAKKTRINPRHLQLAIKNDLELSTYLSGVTVAEGGVLPKVEDALQKKKRVQ
ncbi:MAG: hypothetical protein KVP17_000230 [Porospora cf. gigantea B]|uniref:uncharacterized protein n=1 Tax=Porospora cf. gigantea B TaxID=2853592 RepID=UPI003571A6B9|nr:MAG: hypothetical protein KVP17_000230 [Porospora cf. gigantea B]